KRAILIPAPAWANPPQSKRVRKDGSVRKSGFAPKGVCESPKKRASKLAFYAQSCAQANELTRERQLRQTYTKFFRTDDGKKFAKEFGKSIPANGSSPGRDHRSRLQGEDSLDFCDPADLPQASLLDQPVEHMEPI